MLDKSIDGALLALRKGLIRGGGEGLEHVKALLALRRVAMPRVLPAKPADTARRNVMRRLVLAALRDGPKGLRELVAYVSARRPELAPAAAYRRTEQAIQKLRMAGLVVREERMRRGVWRLGG